MIVFFGITLLYRVAIFLRITLSVLVGLAGAVIYDYKMTHDHPTDFKLALLFVMAIAWIGIWKDKYYYK